MGVALRLEPTDGPRVTVSNKAYRQAVHSSAFSDYLPLPPAARIKESKPDSSYKDKLLEVFKKNLEHTLPGAKRPLGVDTNDDDDMVVEGRDGVVEECTVTPAGGHSN